ncbi:MAG: molybdopterin-dependent oxidoreductase [Chloroflexi bacterium]|nr:molybdopterin-dependent oxidoreductase [Chloroflexota bacterium]MCY3716401.1 molybdopterin-dependent oxidoreductase [Chloroflexota bacterium]MDE2650904.1 molybdopterin-dependent oxidoreductase [Chloroflexota bacterium]MXX51837.1 molybdopterin-dependent oxidoreductase [Chloroflexota bacterium]MXX84770.1 molybdopterin-dependent oxidoreductase [Chloroflexota bacterium]
MALRSMVGANVKRKEDPGLINGAGKYVGDIKMPGMAHVAFLRSPYAHAKLLGIDCAAAESRAGVLAVITGADLQDEWETVPVAGGRVARANYSHYAISVGRVRHVGEIVAAVIAESAETAADALDDIAVDYEELPAAADLLTAYAGAAPPIFDGLDSNIVDTGEKKSDDVDAVFADAPHSLRQRMHSQRVAGVPMEVRAVLAAPDAVTGGLTIWTSTQIPHGVRSALAEALRLPENTLRVIAPNVGGGFGVKNQLYPEEMALAKLAQLHNKPLRWSGTRAEHFSATTHGRAQIADIEVAFDDAGRILGLRLHVIGELGAYPPFYDIAHLTGLMATGNYAIPAVHFKASNVFTNTVAVAAYRGAGRPEAIYYIERAIDLIAGELDIDPADVRRRNYIQPEQFPYKTPTGSTYDTGDYETNLDTALRAADYPALRAEQAQGRADDNGSLLGIGMATYVEMCGFGPYESGLVRVEPSGTVTVYTGASPHGQGLQTTFAQVVADEIGADYDKIVVRHGDTGAQPVGVGTFGSRSLAVGGSAIVRASKVVREKAIKIAAHMLEAAPGDIEFADGEYRVKGAPSSSLSLSQIAKRAYSERLPDDIDTGLEGTDFFRPPDFIYPFGTHIAVVEVERATGCVRLRNYFSVDDCGPRISPLLVAGQIHGGLAQGIGQALLEQVIYDEQGQLLTGTMMDYTMPRADDFPHFTLDATVTETTLNPLGAKGIGEAATIGSTPAVVNAVMDALRPLGIRHIDMPLTPSRIWEAMQSA